MGSSLPYRLLLLATIFFTGLMLVYNLGARESFGVSVGYTYPEVLLTPQDLQDTVTLEYADDEILDSQSEQSVTVPADLTVSFPLELNSATQEELMLIPGIGEVMSRRIVQYRAALGGYTALEQLREIKGVGDVTYQKISAYLYLAGDEWDTARRQGGEPAARPDDHKTKQEGFA